MKLIVKTRYLFCFIFMIVSTCVVAQDSLKLEIDSIYSYDSLRYKKADKVYFFSKEEDISFFISKPDPKDSIYFQWLGIDKNRVLLKNPVIRYTNIKGGVYQFELSSFKFGKLKTLFILNHP